MALYPGYELRHSSATILVHLSHGGNKPMKDGVPFYPLKSARGEIKGRYFIAVLGHWPVVVISTDSSKRRDGHQESFTPEFRSIKSFFFLHVVLYLFLW